MTGLPLSLLITYRDRGTERVPVSKEFNMRPGGRDEVEKWQLKLEDVD